MSSIAKTSISLSKKDLTKSRIPPVASRNVVFYHKATLGQITIDLNSLVMPSEMPSQVQATSDEISGARLALNKKNLSLVSAAKGPLVQGLDYIVVDSYTIRFIGGAYSTGTEANEIFIGTINCAPISDLVVASSRDIIKTTTVAIGQTIVNLGNEYKVNANPNEDVGSVRIWINGVMALRGQDYTEVDSGNGFGTTILLLSTPTLTPWTIIAEFGVRSVTDQDALGNIEEINGKLLKIATDLADVAGTSVNDYITANPSDVERRVFGDMVLVHERILDVEIPITDEAVLFTPTGSWVANTTYSGSYFREGDKAAFRIKVSTTGAPTATQLTIALPLSIDLAKIPFSSSSITEIGTAVFRDNAGITFRGTVTYQSATVISIFTSNTSGTYESHQTTTDLIPFTWNSGDYVEIDFIIPVVGWTATQTIRQILGL